MAANPSQEGKADAADLSSIHPYALHAFIPHCINAEDSQRVDQPPFDGVDDVSYRGFALTLTPLEDRIAHDLSRAVPCQASTSVNPNGFVTGWRKNPVVSGARADGDHFGVAQKKQGVGDFSFDTLLLKFLHQDLSVFVGDDAKFSDIHHVITPSELTRGAEATFSTLGLAEHLDAGFDKCHVGYWGEEHLCNPFASLD